MNNYPELAYYKREWIPLLEAAKGLVDSMTVKYVCNALYAAARSSNASARAEEMISVIESALGDHDTVTEWLHANHPDATLYSTSYRLAWLDHIIKECQK